MRVRTVRLLLTLGIGIVGVAPGALSDVVVAPAPEGQAPCAAWSVTVNGLPVPVYSANVFHGGPAYFCSFSMDRPVQVTARPAWPVRDVVVRPRAKRIEARLDGFTIALRLDEPGQFSVEPNHLINHPLYIFANPVEENAPDPAAPNVLYFGPGVHTVELHTVIGSGQEVYLSDGAWIRATMPPREKEAPIEEQGNYGLPRYHPLFHADHARDIVVRGRGVIDMSGLDWGSRCAMTFSNCTNVSIEGVTILDCPRWTIVFGKCENVRVRNVKLIGHRESNDGIDLCNTVNAAISDSFVRVGDDGIIVKTFPGSGPSRDIDVENCVLWNDKVHAIGISAEAGEPIHDIRFRNIDIIHDLTTDFDMAWSMAVYTEDRGPISDIAFEDIRCEDTRAKLIQVCVRRGKWSTTGQLGPIERIVFRNIESLGPVRPRSSVEGADEANHVMDVLFENLRIGGQVAVSLETGNIEVNEFAKNIRVIGADASDR